VAAYIDTS
jgi:chromatin assembly factor 1 subunit A